VLTIKERIKNLLIFTKVLGFDKNKCKMLAFVLIHFFIFLILIFIKSNITLTFSKNRSIVKIQEMKMFIILRIDFIQYFEIFYTTKTNFIL